MHINYFFFCTEYDVSLRTYPSNRSSSESQLLVAMTSVIRLFLDYSNKKDNYLILIRKTYGFMNHKYKIENTSGILINE